MHKFYEKHKSQYEVTIESCTEQKFSAKTDLPSTKQNSKFAKTTTIVT